MNDPGINTIAALRRSPCRFCIKMSGKEQHDAVHFFRVVPDMRNKGEISAFVKNSVMADDSDQGRHILCRHCGHLITRASARITVNGSHAHSFANPHGVVFHIGCFSTAEGCGYAGPLSNEFTWFTGYNWRIAVCGACLVHLGWLFVSDSESRFNGLILDQLIDE